MTKILLMTAVFFSAHFVQAQHDDKAKNILDQVSEKFRSFKTISADFSFSMRNIEMEIDERNDGSIKLKGQKYLVVLPDVGVDVFSDGTTIWNYMEDGNQVTISNVDDEGSELMDPSSLFRIYEKGFNSKFVDEKMVDGKVLFLIELYPDESVHDVTKITLEIDKTTMMIKSAQLYGTDGNLYGINVKKLETDKEFPDSDFVFDATKYGDVEVIDFR